MCRAAAHSIWRQPVQKCQYICAHQIILSNKRRKEKRGDERRRNNQIRFMDILHQCSLVLFWNLENERVSWRLSSRSPLCILGVTLCLECNH